MYPGIDPWINKIEIMHRKNHEFNSVPVVDGTEMGLYVAFPEGRGSFPAIIVLHEGFGLTEHIRNVAERLCKEACPAVAPELHHRSGHRV